MPEQLGLAGLAAAAASFVYPAASHATGLGLPCPLRTAARAVGLAPAPAPWSPAARQRAWWAVGVLAAASWAFQLHRFGWI